MSSAKVALNAIPAFPTLSPLEYPIAIRPELIAPCGITLRAQEFLDPPKRTFMGYTDETNGENMRLFSTRRKHAWLRTNKRYYLMNSQRETLMELTQGKTFTWRKLHVMLPGQITREQAVVLLKEMPKWICDVYVVNMATPPDQPRLSVRLRVEDDDGRINMYLANSDVVVMTIKRNPFAEDSPLFEKNPKEKQRIYDTQARQLGIAAGFDLSLVSYLVPLSMVLSS